MTQKLLGNLNAYIDKAYVTETKMIFCSGQCAGNEQMSMEG